MVEWSDVISALIAAAPPSFIAWMAYRASREAKKIGEQTHDSVNSRMDKLLALTEKLAKIEATDDERARVAEEQSQ